MFTKFIHWIILLHIAGHLCVDSRAVENSGAPELLPAVVDAELSSLQQQVSEKVAAIDSALVTATTAGTLKASTDAYYRTALARFSDSKLLQDVPKTAYPPLFDTSMEMQRINVAWEDLRMMSVKCRDEIDRLIADVYGPLAILTYQAARTAEKPEDLAVVNKLLASLTTLCTAKGASITGSRANDALAVLVSGMQEVLDAKSAGNEERLLLLMERFGAQPHFQGFPLLQNYIPMDHRSVWGIFHARICAEFQQRADAASRNLENAIMSRKSQEDLEHAFAPWKAAAEVHIRVRMSNRFGPSSFNHGMPMQWGKGYKIIASYVAGKATKEQFLELATNLDSNKGIEEQWSEEFALFYAALIKGIQQTNEQSDSEDALGKQEKEVRQWAAELDKGVVEKLSSIKEPKDLEKLLAELDAVMPIVKSADTTFPLEAFLEDLQQASVRLESILSVWNTAKVSGFKEIAENFGERSKYKRQIDRLQEYAYRAILTSKLNLPELLRPPLSDVPINLALESTAVAAAKARDWKKCFEISQLVGTRESEERKEAIRMYLAGRQLEVANDFGDAIANYVTVIRMVNDHGPTTECIERLKELGKSHPEAFPKPKWMDVPMRWSGEF